MRNAGIGLLFASTVLASCGSDLAKDISKSIIVTRGDSNDLICATTLYPEPGPRNAAIEIVKERGLVCDAEAMRRGGIERANIDASGDLATSIYVPVYTPPR